MLSLRPYQKEAIAAIYDYFRKKSGHPIVVLPTGAGKSLVCADFVKGVMEADPTQRILIVTHVQELVGQNFEEMIAHYPECDAGIFSAGLGCRNHQAQVLFCSIQSIYNKADLINWANLIIIDECHLMPFKGEGMYRSFINDMLRYNKRLKVIGLTATAFRMQGGWLHKGEGALFTDIAYEADILDLVQQKYLCRLTSKSTETKLDTTGVPKKGGEFVAKKLELAVDLPHITKAAVEEIVYWGANRKTWLAFGSGVEHCKNIRDEIASHGVSAECIFGNTPKRERNDIIRAHKAQELRAMVCRFVGTTGYNCKSIDLIADLAPTQSPALHVQKLGRGTRLFPGKDNCLVLDFAQNIARHGAIDQVNPHQPRKRDEDEETEAPVKTCPECAEFVRIQDMECPECGYVFPPSAPKIATTSSTLAPMSDHTPKRLEVSDIKYSKHEKVGAPPSMLVQYLSGLKIYKEWVPIENPSGRRFAASWWRKRTQGPMPSNVGEALEVAPLLVQPKEITVSVSGKYPKVLDVHF